jgi:hypothetical protein
MLRTDQGLKASCYLDYSSMIYSNFWPLSLSELRLAPVAPVLGVTEVNIYVPEVWILVFEDKVNERGDIGKLAWFFLNLKVL